MNQTAFNFESIPNKEIFSDLAENIVRSFFIYHQENPQVYDLLLRFTKEVYVRGRRRYSIVAVFERVRWYTTIETNGDEFKLNNNYRSCYSRLIMHEHPQFNGMFSTRVTPGVLK